MSTNIYIGRDNFAEKLSDLLLNKNSNNGNLRIQSIEGPGGIGKSALLNHVLEKIDLSPRKYIKLSINGNEIKKSGAFSAINYMIANAKCRTQPEKPMGKLFPRVATITATHNKILSQLQNEAAKNKENKLSPDMIETAFTALTSGGKLVNKFSEKSKEFLNFEEIDKELPNIIRFLDSSKVLMRESPPFLAKLGIGGDDIAQRNALRENALIPLSQALSSDLSAILSRYEKHDKLKPSQSKIKEADRLLLIIDDYETTKDVLGEFLLHLLEHLKNASFETVVIILGRDDIKNTHPSWDQHFSGHMERAIKLKPLNQDQMNDLIDSLNEVTTKEKERAWNDTRGYPLFVKLWLEEYESGGRNGTSLMRFHQRTTRWMNAEQKRWLNYILLIEGAINRKNLAHILGGKEEAERAWEWFRAEGSIRDESFKVTEYIRSRLVDFLKLDDPVVYEEILEKIKPISIND